MDTSAFLKSLEELGPIDWTKLNLPDDFGKNKPGPEFEYLSLDLQPKDILAKEHKSWKDQFFSPSNSDYDSRVISGHDNNTQLKVALRQFSLFNQPKTQAPTFLANYRKEGSPDLDLSNYRFDVDHGTGPSKRMNMEAVSRWYDAPYTFVLSYQWDPLATVSFKAEEGGILISQIQGVKGMESRLRPLKWAMGLVGLTSKWAEENGIEEVRLLPAARNTSPAVKKSGFMNYDVPAKREGFKYDQKREVYVKRTGK
ncbi:MAG: hypothetical protein AABX35_01635 [Nanoarchaeota archaeon]